MTKRPLDETEKKLTEQGVKRVTKEIEELKEQIQFNEKTIAFQKVQSDYQEATRPYLKKKKESEDKKVMGALNETVERDQFTLDNMNDHLKNGVEIKEIKELNKKEK